MDPLVVCVGIEFVVTPTEVTGEPCQAKGCGDTPWLEAFELMVTINKKPLKPRWYLCAACAAEIEEQEGE